MSIIDDALKKAVRQKGRPYKKLIVNTNLSVKKNPRIWIIPGFLTIGFFFLIGYFLTGIDTKRIAPKPLIANERTTEDFLAPLPAKKNIIPVEKETVISAAENPAATPKNDIVKEHKPPELFLSGIIYENEEPLAFINNQIIKKGELVEGAKVVDIEPNRVLLTFEEEELSLFLRR
ncbi:MAG: hypothetical protein U9R31_00375 [Candidatus Omnitrophota bacterium]|nr:hypothetical protein [Candidatus Omnitrophota bacterium]